MFDVLHNYLQPAFSFNIALWFIPINTCSSCSFIFTVDIMLHKYHNFKIHFPIIRFQFSIISQPYVFYMCIFSCMHVSFGTTLSNIVVKIHIWLFKFHLKLNKIKIPHSHFQFLVDHMWPLTTVLNNTDIAHFHHRRKFY